MATFFNVLRLDFRAIQQFNMADAPEGTDATLSKTLLEAGGRQKYVIAAPAIHILLPSLEAVGRQKYVQIGAFIGAAPAGPSIFSRRWRPETARSTSKWSFN
jgi:hypothetical protein